jgi:glycosyltransferase involved in cell wall biosynthesis
MINCLETQIGQPTEYVLVNDRNAARIMQDQRLINPSNNKITLLENNRLLQKSIEVIRKNKEAIHIFLSIWGSKRLFLIILYGLLLKRNIMIVLEPYAESPHGYWKDEPHLISSFKVLIRKIAYPVSGILFRLVARKKPPCILAVSEIAEDQLEQAKFNQDSTFPFGYFINKRQVDKREYTKSDKLQVMFSGSLIKRKGLDIAIRSIAEVNKIETKICFDIYGQGDINKFLIHDINGIEYKGTYQQDEAQKIISQYDLLLYPSRHDGWGLVVNEALMQNVPVIVSDRVGAKVLVEKSGAGMVFQSENVQELKNLLLRILQERKTLDRMKANCTKIGPMISPHNGSGYLLEIINFYFFNKDSKPEPYWKKNYT